MTNLIDKQTMGIRSLRFFYLAILIIGLAACHERMSPLTSGVLEYPAQNGGFTKSGLSSDQLQKLSVWLAKHSDNWHGCYATPPGPIFSVSLKHANGKSSSLMLLVNGTSLRADNLDESNHPCALQSVTEQEINELRALLLFENQYELRIDRATTRPKL